MISVSAVADNAGIALDMPISPAEADVGIASLNVFGVEDDLPMRGEPFKGAARVEAATVIVWEATISCGGWNCAPPTPAAGRVSPPAPK